jgi:hypothetical protein
MLVWTIGAKLGVHVDFASVYEVKEALTFSKQAKKLEMIASAERMGVTLPARMNQGRADAADAVGAWKVGIQRHAPQHLSLWDRALYQRKGSLL